MQAFSFIVCGGIITHTQIVVNIAPLAVFALFLGRCVVNVYDFHLVTVLNVPVGFEFCNQQDNSKREQRYNDR